MTCPASAGGKDFSRVHEGGSVRSEFRKEIADTVNQPEHIFFDTGNECNQKEAAVVTTKPSDWINLRPNRSMVNAATAYPGTAAMNKYLKLGNGMPQQRRVGLECAQRKRTADRVSIIGKIHQDQAPLTPMRRSSQRDCSPGTYSRPRSCSPRTKHTVECLRFSSAIFNRGVSEIWRRSEKTAKAGTSPKPSRTRQVISRAT